MSAASDFYLARADQDARDALTCGLDNVRERHLRSEAAWRAMADKVMRSEAMREQADAEKSALLPPLPA
jgi:hypothetical protein